MRSEPSKLLKRLMALPGGYGAIIGMINFKRLKRLQVKQSLQHGFFDLIRLKCLERSEPC